MGTIGHPPDFATWPREARLEWYAVSHTRVEIVTRFRDAVGTSRPEASDRLAMTDLAGAINTLSDGEAPIPVAQDRAAYLRAFRNQLDNDRGAAPRVVISEMAITIDEAADGEYPTAWSCPW